MELVKIASLVAENAARGRFPSKKMFPEAMLESYERDAGRPKGSKSPKNNECHKVQDQVQFVLNELLDQLYSFTLLIIVAVYILLHTRELSMPRQPHDHPDPNTFCG